MIRSIIIASASLWLIACGASVRYSAVKPDNREPGSHGASNDLEQFIQNWMGAPYLLGGMERSGVDCSGFTCRVYKSVYDMSLPRQAADQYEAGKRISESAIQPGDLVFFKNVRRSGIDHVGVYMGGGRFAHASVSSGVTISGLNEDYYRKRFAGARRYF